MIEKVSNGSQAFEINWFSWIRLKILSETDDKIIHRTGSGLACIAPTDLQQLVARQGFATMGNEQFEHLGFLFGQGNITPVAACRVGFEIDVIIAKMIGIEGCGRRRRDCRR